MSLWNFTEWEIVYFLNTPLPTRIPGWIRGWFILRVFWAGLHHIYLVGFVYIMFTRWILTFIRHVYYKSYIPGNAVSIISQTSHYIWHLLTPFEGLLSSYVLHYTTWGAPYLYYIPQLFASGSTWGQATNLDVFSCVLTHCCDNQLLHFSSRGSEHWACIIIILLTLGDVLGTPKWKNTHS